MRYLALDVGEERIGIAISDETGLVAHPVETIIREPGPASFWRIADIVREKGVGAIVVGLPLLLDGSRGKQVRSTRAYVRGLRAYVEVPITYWDERHSTSRAREIMAENRSNRSLDAVAAAVILQEYLDKAEGEANGGG
ncbi:MAG: Holliday junction resolvase RuvX [Chloroflexota bacterium]|nr:Holliday junction resolvase RuvX [Chloroflexota bacterium]